MGEARARHVRDGPDWKCSCRAPAGRGAAVWAVSRHQPLAGRFDWRPGAAADPTVAADAAKGTSVVYQSVSAPYTQWPERFPLLQRGVLAAAGRADALPVAL
jgi:hypothetical protein